MLIGIDDTDSPAGMCTTYLGAVLARRLIHDHMQVKEARLVRLNPNVTFKTRGNAAIALDVEGDPDRAFDLACAIVEELADFSCEKTNPGVVVAEKRLDPAFYQRAVTDFCEIEEAVDLLKRSGARYRGWKNRRGLIGATAAVSSVFPDTTYEILTYRDPVKWGTPREVVRESLFAAEEATFPHTWDTVDRANRVVVCVPHTPDPVLFGIRGESPAWVMRARSFIQSEKPAVEQIWVTNQGTDAHLLPGTYSSLREGLSYPVTWHGNRPPGNRTRGPRLLFDPGQRCGSPLHGIRTHEEFPGYRKGAGTGRCDHRCRELQEGEHQLEKIRLVVPARDILTQAPLCTACGKRMTSAGKDKGYKCRKCGAHSMDAEVQEVPRTLSARVVRSAAIRPETSGKTAVPGCAGRGVTDPAGLHR